MTFGVRVDPFAGELAPTPIPIRTRRLAGGLDVRTPFHVPGRRVKARAAPVLSLLGALGVESPSQDDDDPANVMLRASNLANVTVVGLRTIPPAQRKAELVKVTDAQWADTVLALAAKVPGLGLEDQTRFAFGFAYLVGILHYEAGKDSIWSRVYQKAVKAYRAGESLVAMAAGSPLPGASGGGLGSVALDSDAASKAVWARCLALVRNPGSLGVQDLTSTEVAKYLNKCDTRQTNDQRTADITNSIQQATGHGPQSNAELVYFAATRWCSVATLVGVVKASYARRAAGGDFANPNDFGDRNLFTNAAAAVAGAAQAVGTAVGQAVDWLGDVICKGLQQVFGAKVGGFICAFLTELIKVGVEIIESVIDIILTIAGGILAMFGALIEGNVKGALSALMGAIGTAIFLSPPFADVMEEALFEGRNDPSTGKPFSTSARHSKWVSIASDAAHADPLFPIKAGLAILSFALGGAATPAGVVAIVEACRPVFARLVADICVAENPKVNGAKIDAVIDAVISTVDAAILIGVSIDQFATQIQQKTGQQYTQDVINRMNAAAIQIGNALTKGNIGAAIGALATLAGLALAGTAISSTTSRVIADVKATQKK